MNKWTDHNWVVKSCNDSSWGLATGDVLKFEGTSPNPVTIKKTVGSGDWANNCTHHPGNERTTEKEKVTGNKSGKYFTITLTTVTGGNDKLECTESSLSLVSLPETSLLQSAKRCLARCIRATARKGEQVVKALYALADDVGNEGTDSPNGGWTAEEGGTNATIVPYDMRNYEQRRRQA